MSRVLLAAAAALVAFLVGYVVGDDQGRKNQDQRAHGRNAW